MEMISDAGLNLIMILNLLNPGWSPPVPTLDVPPANPPAVCTVEVACWEALSQLKAILPPDLLAAMQVKAQNSTQVKAQNTLIPFAFVGKDGNLYSIHFGDPEENGDLFTPPGVRGGKRPKCDRTGTSCR